MCDDTQLRAVPLWLFKPHREEFCRKLWDHKSASMTPGGDHISEASVAAEGLLSDSTLAGFLFCPLPQPMQQEDKGKVSNCSSQDASSTPVLSQGHLLLLCVQMTVTHLFLALVASAFH